MVFIKGQSGNQTGLSSRELRLRRSLEDLSEIAIGKLRKLIDCDDKAVSLAAIKEVLARVAPIPKAPLLAVQVNNNTNPHIQALKALSAQIVPQNVPQINAQPIDIIEPNSKATLNQSALDQNDLGSNQVLSNDINAIDPATETET